MPTEQELLQQLSSMGAELNKRSRKCRELREYDDGCAAIPSAVVRGQMTNLYQLLMGMSVAPWGSLVVDSVLDRLEVAGISTGDKGLDETVWKAVWQENGMDAESKLAHRSALLDGRAFALVWPDGPGVSISLDDASQMIVKYREGSRRTRVAALRRWWDDDAKRSMATLYHPKAIYKFQSPKNSSGFEGTRWERREVAGEEWPLRNPLGEVPVVELAVNRRLLPGSYPFARGEFEHCTGLLDRINLLTFLGIVVALWMGFPLRGVIGQELLKDDKNKPIPPFDAQADKVFSFSNPNAKLAQYEAADRKNLSIFDELDQLAVITHTPRHYFPLEQGMSNLSADAIRASEGGLHAKVTGHKSTLGEGHEEILRLAAAMLKDKLAVPRTAEIRWMDHESRSLAERADAASKLKDIIPPQAIMEMVLNATPQQIRQWEAQGGIGAILAAAATDDSTDSDADTEAEPAVAA